ncbi:MAG: hypothetical protein M9952_16535, partial [Microthrixaceae bacterium]|nr:hypothetical protein [Microthrixaceae bacterium]
MGLLDQPVASGNLSMATPLKGLQRHVSSQPNGRVIALGTKGRAATNRLTTSALRKMLPASVAKEPTLCY